MSDPLRLKNWDVGLYHENPYAAPEQMRHVIRGDCPDHPEKPGDIRSPLADLRREGNDWILSSYRREYRVSLEDVNPEFIEYVNSIGYSVESYLDAVLKIRLSQKH